MALAALGTFLAYADANADDSIDVLVASRELQIGETITADDVELVAVELHGPVRGLFGAEQAAIGRRVVAAIGRGEFIQDSATSSAPADDESLELSVVLPASRAVGSLSPGERVDVFSTWAGDVTELIAVDARVLEMRSGGAGLAAGSSVVVRLALRDFGQVEALVHAQAAGDITMIRAALGSSVEDVGRSYRPGRAGTAGRIQSGADAEDGR